MGVILLLSQVLRLDLREAAVTIRAALEWSGADLHLSYVLELNIREGCRVPGDPDGR